MKNKIYLLALILTVALLVSGCGSSPQVDTMYCRNCGKQISSDSNYCTFCGASMTEPIKNDSTPEPTKTPIPTHIPVVTPEPTIVPTPTPAKIVETTYTKSQRSVGGKFKDRGVDYNVFTREVENCSGCYFSYMSWARDDSKVSCVGTRDVYVRDRNSELKKDDSGWIYVGSFEYDYEKDSVIVDLTWEPTDVYAVAVVIAERRDGCRFYASWGENVTFYSYN